MGKSFNDLLNEEKFTERKVSKVSILERSATATAPCLKLYDNPGAWGLGKRREVDSVIVGSDSNPSKEFISKLIKLLEDSWGKYWGGDGLSEWIWKTNKFWATLKHEDSLRLKINERSQRN